MVLLSSDRLQEENFICALKVLSVLKRTGDHSAILGQMDR